MLIAITIAEKIQGLQKIAVLQVLSFWVFIDFGKKFLRELRNFSIKSKKTQKLKTCRASQYFVI